MDVPHTLHPAQAFTLDDTVDLSDEEDETIYSDTDDEMEPTPMFVRGNDWLPDRIQTTATSISPPYLRMDVPHTLHSTPTPTPMTQYTSRMKKVKPFSPKRTTRWPPMPVKEDERYPDKLIAKILLELYWSFSDYDPQRGKVLRRTLAACRLVCRHWSKIVISFQRQFIILVHGEEWCRASFSWYMLRRTPDLPLSEEGTHQEGGCAWLPQNYREDFVKSHEKCSSDVIRDMLPWLYKRRNAAFDGRIPTDDEKQSVVQNTLATCCLVSHEWNRISTPVLYENILLGGKKSLLTGSLLRRTFRHTQPTHKALVKTMTIELAEDGSTANSLSICFCFRFPNLHKMIIDLPNVDPSTLHSNFAQNLQSLSRCCAIQMRGYFGSWQQIRTQWQSFSIWINFFRRSRSIPCGLFAHASGDYIFYSRTRFYIGEHKTVTGGNIKSSDIKSFQQHLTQTGHNLRSIYLYSDKPSSLPGIDFRENPHLRLLQFNFRFEEKKIRDSHDDVIRWFNSICESVTSKSLVVELLGSSDKLEICNKIQDVLLALHSRIENLSIFISGKRHDGWKAVDLEDVRKLFSRLYEAGIVSEKWLGAMVNEVDAIAFSP